MVAACSCLLFITLDGVLLVVLASRDVVKLRTANALVGVWSAWSVSWQLDKHFIDFMPGPGVLACGMYWVGPIGPLVL